MSRGLGPPSTGASLAAVPAGLTSLAMETSPTAAPLASRIGDPDMPASGREALILERLQQVCAYAYAHSQFYKNKWDEAGFHPSHLKSLEDFEAKVPVVQKKDLRAAQARAAPFGDYLCVPESDVFHIHGTSGTTGRPTAFAIGRNDWRAMANAHARVMWAMGLRPGDTICVAAIFSLYLGSWGALAGAERLNARCFPFGAGVAGMAASTSQTFHMGTPTPPRSW